MKNAHVFGRNRESCDMEKQNAEGEKSVHGSAAASICSKCKGTGLSETLVQVEYASYQSGHQLSSDIWDYATCSYCHGTGKEL